MVSYKSYLKRIIVAAMLMNMSATIEAERIAILTDVHVTPGNANDIKLKEAVAEINASNADLCILSGDLTNEGSDVQLQAVKASTDKLTKPFFIIPGNHEDNWSQSACKTFVDLWGSDRFVTETDNLIIVGINCGPYMKMGDGHIKQEDLLWLDKTLKERTTNSRKKVLSICHYPLLDDLDNYEDYVRVLQKYPVVTHECGHYHTFRHYVTGGIDAVICRALDLKHDNYGYSILDITSDSVKVYDKRIGVPENLKFAYRINTKFEPLPLRAEENTSLPRGFKVDLVYRDNASIFTRVGVDDNNVYFGNSLGWLKAVGKNDGVVRWSYKTEASLFARPAVCGDKIALPTADKRLVWLNKTNGDILSSENLSGPIVADAVVEKDLLYQGGYKTFTVWNTNTRKAVWKYDSINNYCQASPVIYKDNLIFGAWDTNLRNLDKKSGLLKWKWNNGKSANLLSPGNCVPFVANGKVFIVAPDRYMTAIDLKTGNTVWRDNSHKWRESIGGSKDCKRIYAKTMDGEVFCVDAKADTYKELWKVDAGLGYEHAPCLLIEQSGVVYVGSRRGVVVAIDGKSGTLLWKKKLGKSEINGFDVDKKGNIYLSLIEGTVWRISNNK